MNKMRKVFMGLLILALVIQTIQPTRNLSDTLGDNDISATYAMSAEVHTILRTKCYDCHSNNTRYPWYTYVQPIGWWMAAHIHEGKKHLDFSEFKTYNAKKAQHKLEELSDAINEGWMPLNTYLWMHHDAEITAADRDAINAWLKTLPFSVE
jgi:Haem-binding domain